MAGQGIFPLSETEVRAWRADSVSVYPWSCEGVELPAEAIRYEIIIIVDVVHTQDCTSDSGGAFVV